MKENKIINEIGLILKYGFQFRFALGREKKNTTQQNTTKHKKYENVNEIT